MPYKESINNVNIAYVRIITSTAPIRNLSMPHKELTNCAYLAYV